MVFSQFQAALMGGFDPPFFKPQSSLSFPWQQGYLVIIDSLIKSESLTPKFWQDHSSLMTPYLDQPCQLTLILLPLFVYYHDDLLTLNQQIDTFIDAYSLDPSYQEYLYLFASAIAASLRRQETDLIANLIKNYPQYNLSSHLIWLQTKVSDGIPLNQLIKQFPKTLDPKFYPFLIALFTISDTPEMPHLALKRVSQTPSPQITMGLTGALLGAMGRLDKLPQLWQINYLKRINETELMTKINILWQHWTGNLSEHSAHSIATPLVMQPRSSLRLISQGEYLTFPTLLKKEEH